MTETGTCQEEQMDSIKRIFEESVMVNKMELKQIIYSFCAAYQMIRGPVMVRGLGVGDHWPVQAFLSSCSWTWRIYKCAHSRSDFHHSSNSRGEKNQYSFYNCFAWIWMVLNSLWPVEIYLTVSLFIDCNSSLHCLVQVVLKTTFRIVKIHSTSSRAACVSWMWTSSQWTWLRCSRGCWEITATCRSTCAASSTGQSHWNPSHWSTIDPSFYLSAIVGTVFLR